jgi:hypothetical protein
MNTNKKLALRKQSIRTLTADELSIAHGGQVNGTVTSGPRTTITSGTCIPTRPTTQTKPPTKA